MVMSREQATLLLLNLEDELPVLLKQHPREVDFWPTFDGKAAHILEHVGPEHYEFARSHINCILGAAGLVPSDNEGGECMR